MTDESNAEFGKRVGTVCEAATEGPWVASDEPDDTQDIAIIVRGHENPTGGLVAVASWRGSGEPQPQNAAFIALARTALPEALERLKAADKEYTRLAGEKLDLEADREKLYAECDRLRAEVGRLEAKHGPQGRRAIDRD